jgi:hypothetical protein
MESSNESGWTNLLPGGTFFAQDRRHFQCLDSFDFLQALLGFHTLRMSPTWFFLHGRSDDTRPR